MVKQIVCDKCKKEINDYYKITIEKIPKFIYNSNITYDLCEECNKALTEFIKTKPSFLGDFVTK